MDKVAADMDKALEVAQKKDDAYFNRAKLIYNYQLTKPETTYKDWTYDKALDEVRKAIAIEELPVYVQLEGDIQFAKKDYAAALASYEKVNKTNMNYHCPEYIPDRAGCLIKSSTDPLA